MDKDIVEEGVEVSILQVLDNPNQTTSTLMIKILEFNKSFMINWVELINNIDEQLFDKYNLSIEEREHIKNSIKDMQRGETQNAKQR